MKYQVGVTYTWTGEFSVEADSPEEAIEFVRDETFSDPWEEASGNHTLEIDEVYEWDEAAQEKHREETMAIIDKYIKERKVEGGESEGQGIV